MMLAQANNQVANKLQINLQAKQAPSQQAPRQQAPSQQGPSQQDPSHTLTKFQRVELTFSS
jgi:hypothetical protein